MASKIEYTQGLHKARNKLIELEKRYSAVQWLSHHIQHSIVENIKKYPIVISCLSILTLVGLCFVWPYQDVLIYLK